MKNKYHISRRKFLAGSSAFAIGLTLNPYNLNSANINKLNFYNWDDYIADNTLAEFEEVTGINTKMDFFADNDELFTKLRQGNPGYDLIVPSGDYVEKMIAANMLEKINPKKIPNIDNIDKKFMDPSFDPGRKYSIPYMWGTVGIGFDKKYLSNTPDSWGVLYNSDKYSGNIAMLSEGSTVLAIALKYLGYSANSRDVRYYKQAEELLIEQKKHIKVFAEDNGQDLLASGDVILAQEWNGDIAQLMVEDNNISYVVPKEGSLIWEDCLCIPREAPHIENAHKLINYILDANVGAEIADYIQYATPNIAAKNLMGEDYIKNPAIFPNKETLNLCENQIYLGEDMAKVIQDTWTRVLAY